MRWVDSLFGVGHSLFGSVDFPAPAPGKSAGWLAKPLSGIRNPD